MTTAKYTLTGLGGAPAVTSYALNELFGLPNRLHRLFDGDCCSPTSCCSPRSVAYLPPLSVVETEDNVVVSAELAGVRRQDVKVRVENGVLTIEGAKTPEPLAGGDEGAERKTNGGRVHFNDRCYGKFRRSLTLPCSISGAEVRARFHKGLLTISLPKAEQAKYHQIEIES